MTTIVLVARRATLALLTCLAAHLSALSAAAQVRTPVRTTVKTPPPATVTPAAASSAVRAAFLTALAQPAVSAAAKAEIQRQLRVNRPMAFISGTWVSLVDLGRVYGHPGVRAAITASLGQSGPTLVNAAILDPGRIVLAFTPQQLGQLMMGEITKDLAASMAPGALQGNVTDGLLIEVLVMMGVTIVVTALVVEVLHHHMESDPDPTPTPPAYDPDADDNGNGIPNYMDTDDDGDGYADGQDAYPNDPNRHICDCGRPGIYFGTAITDQLANALHSALSTAKAQLRTGVSLGAVQAGQTAAIRIVTP